MKQQDDLYALRKSVQEFNDTYPQLSPDDAFIAWFLRVRVVDNDEKAINALVGAARDKGVDAIYIDPETKTVFIIQGKYRQVPTAANENLADVMSLSTIGR